MILLLYSDHFPTPWPHTARAVLAHFLFSPSATEGKEKYRKGEALGRTSRHSVVLSLSSVKKKEAFAINTDRLWSLVIACAPTSSSPLFSAHPPFFEATTITLRSSARSTTSTKGTGSQSSSSYHLPLRENCHIYNLPHSNTREPSTSILSSTHHHHQFTQSSTLVYIADHRTNINSIKSASSWCCCCRIWRNKNPLNREALTN